ncbi:Wzt carbohydrate-binding domain-containing protein [Serratia ureilytica]
MFGPIAELQAGLVIKTVEGITVFGTSTLYHKKNIHDAKGGDILRATFELDLALCEGSYFVSLAIANAISHADMSYLDKKTDVIVLKVIEPRTTMSGIAALPVSLSLEKWSGEHE